MRSYWEPRCNISRSDLSVEELSRELGMSRVNLYKRLVAMTGKTPIEFIRVIRLKHAAKLLRETRMNISEVAYQVGFNNPKYFTKSGERKTRTRRMIRTIPFGSCFICNNHI